MFKVVWDQKYNFFKLSFSSYYKWQILTISFSRHKIAYFYNSCCHGCKDTTPYIWGVCMGRGLGSNKLQRLSAKTLKDT